MATSIFHPSKKKKRNNRTFGGHCSLATIQATVQWTTNIVKAKNIDLTKNGIIDRLSNMRFSQRIQT